MLPHPVMRRELEGAASSSQPLSLLLDSSHLDVGPQEQVGPHIPGGQGNKGLS